MVVLLLCHVALAAKSRIHARAHQVEQHIQADGAVHQQEAELAIGLPRPVLLHHRHLLAIAATRFVTTRKRPSHVLLIVAAHLHPLQLAQVMDLIPHLGPMHVTILPVPAGVPMMVRDVPLVV